MHSVHCQVRTKAHFPKRTGTGWGNGFQMVYICMNKPVRHCSHKSSTCVRVFPHMKAERGFRTSTHMFTCTCVHVWHWVQSQRMWNTILFLSIEDRKPIKWRNVWLWNGKKEIHTTAYSSGQKYTYNQRKCWYSWLLARKERLMKKQADSNTCMYMYRYVAAEAACPDTGSVFSCT